MAFIELPILFLNESEEEGRLRDLGLPVEEKSEVVYCAINVNKIVLINPSNRDGVTTIRTGNEDFMCALPYEEVVKRVRKIKWWAKN